jgi:hypothetical protein
VAIWARAATLAFLAVGMGCARRPRADLASPYESGPRLISCPESIGPTNTNRQRVSVELRFTVNAEGRVDAGSVRLVPNLNASYASESTVAAARAVALSCVYTPAMRGRRPVAATISQWFTVEAVEAPVRRP